MTSQKGGVSEKTAYECEKKSAYKIRLIWWFSWWLSWWFRWWFCW
jgi:hypothetical protein